MQSKNLEVKNDEFFHNYDQGIIDDETFVQSNFFQLPGQEFYVADARGNMAEKYRVSKKSKFSRMFLFWEAICICGKRHFIHKKWFH